MERTFTYLIKTSPGEILEIARSRIEDHPSASIQGDRESGVFTARGIHISYVMKPGDGGTEISITVNRKPPIPWKLIRSYLDKEAEKW